MVIDSWYGIFLAESEVIALAENKEQELVAHITASQKIEII